MAYVCHALKFILKQRLTVAVFSLVQKAVNNTELKRNDALETTK